METLGRDIIGILGLKLSLKDSIYFSLVNRSINEKVSNNDNFWMNRLIKDFPGFISNGDPKITKLRYNDLIQMGVEKKSAILFIKNSHLFSCKYKRQYFNLIEKEIKPTDFFPPKTHHKYYYETTPQIVDFLKNADFGNVPQKYGEAPFRNIIIPLLDEKHIPFFDLLCIYIDMNNLRVNGNTNSFEPDGYIKEKLKINTRTRMSLLISQSEFGKPLFMDSKDAIFSLKANNILRNIFKITHEILTSKGDRR